MQAAPHGPRGNLEEAGNVDAAQALEVAEREHRAQVGRQGIERRLDPDDQLAMGGALLGAATVAAGVRLGDRLHRASLAHLVLVPNPPQHSRGDFVLTDGLVSDGEGSRHTYSGIGIYRPELFAGCEPGKFPLLPLLRKAIAQRALSGELHQGQWYDIGTTERLAALDARLA